MISDWAGLALSTLAIPFFIGGSVGLLRFPDLHARLHALSKADNLGLGFVVAGMLVATDSWVEAVKLGLIWAGVTFGSSTAGYLLANSEPRKEARRD
jgi:multicomponent Na+:H+ antiporter subunit G